MSIGLMAFRLTAVEKFTHCKNKPNHTLTLGQERTRHYGQSLSMTNTVFSAIINHQYKRGGEMVGRGGRKEEGELRIVKDLTITIT